MSAVGESQTAPRPVLEVARLDVKPELWQEFEAAFKVAQQIISTMPGYRWHELQRCLEGEHRYLLLVSWERLEDHTEGFRGSACQRTPYCCA